MCGSPDKNVENQPHSLTKCGKCRRSDMKEDKNETRWDKLLQIRTMGRDDSSADQYRYPYEPTPYSVLERLADSGRIRKGNTLLDYGCGKGRVEILKKVISRILDSWYDNERSMQLFFYYPSDEYISWLMTVDELLFSDEIDCRDLFPGNDPREKIVIFECG